MMNNVLLIEDCEKTRTMFKEILIIRRLAKNIVEADNGIQGLRKAKNQKFDLIISDNRMPKYSGIDLSIDLINLKEYHPNEFLIISGSLSEVEVTKLLYAKVQNILSKPIELNRFINQINNTHFYNKEEPSI